MAYLQQQQQHLCMSSSSITNMSSRSSEQWYQPEHPIAGLCQPAIHLIMALLNMLHSFNIDTFWHPFIDLHDRLFHLTTRSVGHNKPSHVKMNSMRNQCMSHWEKITSVFCQNDGSTITSYGIHYSSCDTLDSILAASVLSEIWFLIDLFIKI